MTQELRNLAGATKLDWGWYDARSIRRDIGNVEDAEYIAAANPAAILALLDRLEKAEKDAERWHNLCDLVNDERASVTFYGRLSTINTGLEVNDSGDLHDELDIAMEASK